MGRDAFGFGFGFGFGFALTACLKRLGFVTMRAHFFVGAGGAVGGTAAAGAVGLVMMTRCPWSL